MNVKIRNYLQLLLGVFKWLSVLVFLCFGVFEGLRAWHLKAIEHKIKPLPSNAKREALQKHKNTKTQNKPSIRKIRQKLQSHQLNFFPRNFIVF